MEHAEFSPWPDYGQEEIELVSSVLRSGKVNYWTGNEARDFEREFAKYSNTRYAVAVANGSVALELALRALEIGSGDEVIVSPRSFIASASCIANIGAKPVFVDVDYDSQNISAKSIEPLLTRDTKAIICVHLAGWPCDMNSIMSLAEYHGLKVIEDCAQAHGGVYKGQPVGSLGHVAAFSFCQDKIMTTGGEGGMLTTNDAQVWEKAWAYKDHGKSYSAVYEQSHPPGFRWLHESFGTNWRLTEMQAAIGRFQLRKMQSWHQGRTENAMSIAQACRPFATKGVLRLPDPPEDIEHAYYRFYVFIEPDSLRSGWNRDKIVSEINARGVPCFQGSCSEVYLEKAFDNTGFRPTRRLAVAKKLGETSLTFLVHPTLSKAEIDRTCNAIEEIFTVATTSRTK